MHLQSNTSKRLAIVARVSTEDQEQYGTSLDEQVDRCRKLGEALSYTVAPEHIYRGDESGLLPLDRRSIIQRMLADARSREFDGVAFYKLDRMGRRLKYILELWDKLDELGIAVVVVDPLVDASTSVGRLIRNVLASVAEFEVDTILERTMAGKRRKLARGETWLTGRKYGYSYTRVDHATHTPGRITINQEQAHVVRRIYERRVAGASPERIAKELTADGIPAPGGEGPWWGRTVADFISDSAYKGDGKWGRYQTVRLTNGKRVSRIRRDKEAIIDTPYPAIISPEVWQVANDVGDRGERHPVRTTPDNFLLYGGMVRCAEHDRVMTGSGSNRRTPRYQCKRHKPTGGWACHQVPARALDEEVWHQVEEALLDSERFEAAIRDHLAKLEADRAGVGERKREVARDLAAVGEEIAYLLRVARETKLSPSLLEQQMAEVNVKESRLRRELQMLSAQEQVFEMDKDEEERVFQMLHTMVNQAHYYTPTQRRALLDHLHVQVTVKGDRFTIEGLLTPFPEGGRIGMHSEHASRCAPGMHPLGFRLTGKLVA